MAKRFLNSTIYWELKFRCDGLPNSHIFKRIDEALTFLAKVIDYSTDVKLTRVIEERKDFTEDALKRVNKYKEAAS